MVASHSIEHIAIKPGHCGGQPHIAGRRIKVQHVAAWYEDQGLSVDYICEQFDLTPQQVHAALAYYHDHRAQIEQDRRDDERFVAQMMAETPSKLRRKRGA